jgi:hypothetical protein
MSDTTSIDGLVVKFLTVVRTLKGKKSRRTHYKVTAEIKTARGTERQAYWFVEKSAFLRQKPRGARKVTRVGFNGKQRVAIQALVQKYKKSSA